MSISSKENTLPLLRGGSVSLEGALIDDDNVLHRLEYPKKQEEFWSYLVSHKSDIEAIVRFHLRVDHCQVADESQWLYGSYNVCIPVCINWPSEDRVLVRIPLPYKVGEANNPGNVEEKLRWEVATYIWIREHCPTVPIPELYAFAFPNGQTVWHYAYRSIEPYILDILQCHDNRIYYQPNAIHSTNDGEQQLAALTMMRGLLPQFVSREYSNGPFVLTLTDLHPSNIFVDEDWHITCLIDLEWACPFPIEMRTLPYWLTGQPIDDIEHGERLQNFETVMNEFIDAFEAQETSISHSENPFQANILRKCWDRGSFWYFQAVHSAKGMLRVFIEHIQRRYCEDHCTRRVFDHTVSPYWCIGVADLIEKKLVEEVEYKDQLQKRFAVGRQ